MHRVGAPPSPHDTLQLPVDVHSTRHVPVQVTSQLPSDVQTTWLSGPTVALQVLALLHTNEQRSPQVSAHVLALPHAAVQSAPQDWLHCGPSLQTVVHLSPQCALQLSAKLEHIGQHDSELPQSRVHGEPFAQTQLVAVSAVHAGARASSSPLHATRTPNTTASVTAPERTLPSVIVPAYRQGAMRIEVSCAYAFV